MTSEVSPISSQTPKNRGLYCFLFVLGSVLLLLGIIATAGSLMSDRISGKSLGSPFDVIFDPILFYMIPSILIAFSLAKLNASFRVSIVGVMLVTCFGWTITLVGEVMKTNNYFVRADESTTQAFNNVEIIYQKRFNLIRNLDISSKDYQAHERLIIQDIVSARKSALSAATDNEKLSTIEKFDSSIRNLVVNIEQYPNLKADGVVLQLMKEISATERELLEKKNEFNRQVTEYNRSIRLMPYALTARIFNFQPRRFVDKESISEIYDAGKLLSPPS